MKTENLVALLATGIAPVERHVPAKRFGAALLAAACGALLLMLWRFGVRPDLAAVAQTPLFWEKLAFPLVLAVLALGTAARLATPGRRVGGVGAGLAVPVAVVWLAAALLLWHAEPAERLPLVLGVTWRVCPFNIAMLSVPGFIAVLWAIKGLAPTRLRLAGAAGGLLAGATATVVYCLHCPEMGVAFWAVWYLLGMLIPAAVGALIGPRVLRW
jgi:hypothetical protein